MSVAIKHNGIITEVTSSSIHVSIEEGGGGCGGCAVSMFCGARNNDKSSVVTFTDKDCDVSSYKVGDKVSLSFSGATQLQASLLVMGIPSLLLLGAVLLSLFMGMSQGASVITGLLLVVIYLFILYKVKNLIRGRFRWTLLGKTV